MKKPDILNWKKLSLEEKTNWCAKWFLVFLFVYTLKSVIEAFQIITILKLNGLL